jgi:hypothetical protein
MHIAVHSLRACVTSKIDLTLLFSVIRIETPGFTVRRNPAAATRFDGSEAGYSRRVTQRRVVPRPVYRRADGSSLSKLQEWGSLPAKAEVILAMSISALWDFARLSVIDEGRVWLIPPFMCWI